MSEKKKINPEIWVNKFTEESAAQFRERINEMKILLNDPEAPIIIYIDSYGGYVDALAKMIETMNQTENPLITCCLGKAMSCGAILLSHGDYRYCGPDSRVMVHEVSSGAWGDVHDIKNDAEETVRLNKHFLGLLAKNCDIEGGYKGLRKIIKEHDGREIWMDAEKALEFKIVDEIGTPAIIPVVNYDLYTIMGAPRSERVQRAKQVLGIEQEDSKSKEIKKNKQKEKKEIKKESKKVNKKGNKKK